MISPEFLQERRGCPRKRTALEARVTVRFDAQTTGFLVNASRQRCTTMETQDISRGGLLLERPACAEEMTPAELYLLMGGAVTVDLECPPIRVRGEVVRVETSPARLAVMIHHVSPLKAWQDLCELQGEPCALGA